MIQIIILGGTIAAIAAGCTPDTEKDDTACKGADTIIGEIIEGRAVAAGTDIVLPFKISTTLSSSVPISDVRVGYLGADHLGVPAQLTSVPSQRWEAQLFATDLEGYRDANDMATLPVAAIDACGKAHIVDTAKLALGPPLASHVGPLTLALTRDPATECYVPSGGAITPRVTVTAQLGARNAKVSLLATHGVFFNNNATQDVVLAANSAGTAATASSIFLPTSAGVATIVASATGSDPVAATIVVADGPTLTAPATALARDVSYTVTIASTGGTLDVCFIEEVVANSAAVKAISPIAGDVAPMLSIRPSEPTCTGTERQSLTVRFAATASDDAAVTLRCADTYGRTASATFTIAPPPTP